VAVTHIHLDHAGGVGDVARAFPSATVYVHEKGARHLADPTRLIDSASRVYGPLARLALRPTRPTPPERFHVLADGEEIVVGPDRVLVAVDSPGHAKHHVGLHDSLSGVLFAGDAVGVKLPDGGCPATLDPATRLRPATGARVTGPVRRPPPVGPRPGPLRAVRIPTSSWPRPIRPCANGPRRPRGLPRRGDIADALAARFDPLLGDIDAEHKEKLDIMNGVHSNAAGFRRWLEGRDATRREAYSTTILARSSSWRTSKSSREMRPSARSSCRAANCSSSRVWSTTSPVSGGALTSPAALSSRRDCRSSIFRPGPVLLGLVALQFSECRSCACHGSLLSGRGNDQVLPARAPAQPQNHSPGMRRAIRPGGGGSGIRTHGTHEAQRFSRPSDSATLASLRGRS
jgi:hypothetical protein